jgi:hypothetical protein
MEDILNQAFSTSQSKWEVTEGNIFMRFISHDMHFFFDAIILFHCTISKSYDSKSSKLWHFITVGATYTELSLLPRSAPQSRSHSS